jgi:hypothetical protein
MTFEAIPPPHLRKTRTLKHMVLTPLTLQSKAQPRTGNTSKPTLGNNYRNLLGDARKCVISPVPSGFARVSVIHDAVASTAIISEDSRANSCQCVFNGGFAS